MFNRDFYKLGRFIAKIAAILILILQPISVLYDIDQTAITCSREQIPESYKCNVSDIYSSNEKVKIDIENCNKAIEELSNQLYELEIIRLIEKYSSVGKIINKLSNYAQLSKFIDFKKEVIFENEINLLDSKNETLFRDILARALNEKDNIKDKKYYNFFKYYFDRKKITKCTNSDFFETSLFNAAILSPSKVFCSLNNILPFPEVDFNDRKLGKLSYSKFIAAMQNNNRLFREKVYCDYYETYHKYANVFGEILFSKINMLILYSKYLGYKNVLEYCLNTTDINELIFNKALSTINKYLPLFWRSNSIKASALGLAKINMYDVYVNPYNQKNDYIPFETAKETVINALKPLGKNYVKIVEKIFNERWIDVYETDGKIKNSIQIDFYDVHPYILINYNGTGNDIYTLIHEIGHAVQSYCLSQNSDFLNFGVPEFLIEIPSTLNELLLCEYYCNSSKDNIEKRYYLSQYLDKFRINVFHQAQISEFERYMYESEQTVNNFKNIYLNLNKKYHGKSVNSDNFISVEWTRLQSIYNMNFYSYQYITSFCMANYILNEIKNGKFTIDEILFVQKHDNPIERLSAIGIDIMADDIYDSAMKKYEFLLNEAEKIIKCR